MNLSVSIDVSSWLDMRMDEAFSIKWTEFQKNLSNSFEELREEGIFFDVTLVTDDEVQTQAHKLI